MDEQNARLEHLKMIQSVVARMAQNSFQLKALAATLTAGVLALIGTTNEPNWIVPAAAAIPALMFWVMDAKYLTLEQKYRDLFEDVRRERQIPLFDLNYQSALFGFQRTDFKNFRSWSVLWFYLPIICLMIAASVGIAS